MKNTRKILGAVVAGLVCIVLLVLVIRLISGAFHLLGSALDTILGLALIVGLVVIVIWMFRYAARRK